MNKSLNFYFVFVCTLFIGGFLVLAGDELRSESRSLSVWLTLVGFVVTILAFIVLVKDK